MFATARRRSIAVPIIIAVMTASVLAVQGHSARAASPILFGASPGQRGTETKQEPLNRLEAQTGRRLDVVRMYVRWDTPWPDVADQQIADNGQVEHLSLKPKYDSNGSVILWHDIA